MSTTPANPTLQNMLDRANPNELEEILKSVPLGTLLTPLKRVFTGLVDVETLDLVATADDDDNDQLAALLVTHLQVVTATEALAVGAYMTADIGATMQWPPGGADAQPGICRLSDDGKTLTFKAASNITAITIHYIPRVADMTAQIPPSP